MKVAELLLNLVYPPFCVACGELLPLPSAEDALCDACHERWIKAKGEYCPDCRNREDICRCAQPTLRKLGAECAHLVPYRTPTDTVGKLLMTAKDERYDSLYRFFGQALAERADAIFEPIGQDAIVTWLPRSRSRGWQAGVDQAREMARWLAAIKGWQIEALFDRIKGGAQKELAAEERLIHARASYRLARKHPPLEGQTVVLVDDILTTGASMLAAAELLKQAGAARIVCLTVAQTRQKEKNPM